jgi:outer membrane scaffolding protein for murein synthesis (MipA/OmpV family)
LHNRLVNLNVDLKLARNEASHERVTALEIEIDVMKADKNVFESQTEEKHVTAYAPEEAQRVAKIAERDRKRAKKEAEEAQRVAKAAAKAAERDAKWTAEVDASIESMINGRVSFSKMASKLSNGLSTSDIKTGGIII